MSRIVIIGAGRVGAHCAYALVLRQIAGEVFLLDIDGFRRSSKVIANYVEKSQKDFFKIPENRLLPVLDPADTIPAKDDDKHRDGDRQDHEPPHGLESESFRRRPGDKPAQEYA